MKLILFDIDGTLIEGKFNNSVESFYENIKSQAIKKVYNSNVVINWKEVQGMTDIQIIKNSLNNILPAELITSRLSECIDEIVKLFEKNLHNYHVEPKSGVKELLVILKQRNYVLGLVTGNIRSVAKLKLTKAGLWNYFEVGSFGDENDNRTLLIKEAIKKAKNNYPFIKANEAIYFGDTPKDILAGKNANIITIAVATGIYSEQDLHATDANYVIKDFKNISELIKIIK